MESSSRWNLNRADVVRWGQNALIFLAPLFLIYLASVQNAVQESGLSLDSFKITPIVGGAIVLYVINVATDLLKKIVAGKPAGY